MLAQHQKFACATAEYKDAAFVILGVCYDRSSTFRSGSSHAPSAVRRASHNFECYLHEYEVSLENVPVCDVGDIWDTTSGEALKAEVYTEISQIVGDNKTPIVIGGEHTTAIGAYQAVREHYNNAMAVVFDAHSDMRDRYMGDNYNHACTVRRMTELGEVVVVGVRSFFGAEPAFEHYTALAIKRNGIGQIVDVIERSGKKVYLSVDMDVFDPAYAPGVSNPEPYGLAPEVLQQFIDRLANKIVGLDVCEVVPHYDTGITAILAAKIIMGFLGAKFKARNG